MLDGVRSSEWIGLAAYLFIHTTFLIILLARVRQCSLDIISHHAKQLTDIHPL
jgi:hypothetical protein